MIPRRRRDMGMECVEDGGGSMLLCHCVVVVCPIYSKGVAF